MSKRNTKANWPIHSSDTTMKPNFLLLKLINSQRLQDIKANGKLDWQSLQSKYSDILELFKVQYPSKQ